MTTELVVAALLVFLIAGTIKGTVGLGLPVTSVGLLSLITDPRTAVTLAVLPIFVSNIWQIYRAGETRSALRRYWPFVTVLVLVFFPATALAPALPTEALIFTLGIAIVLFSLTSLAVMPPELADRHDTAGQLTAGALSGFLGGLTAIWSPPMVIYFLSRRLAKDEFIRASGLFFFAGSVPLVAGYFANGLLNATTAPLSALLVVPSLLGFALGERIRGRLNAERFRTAVLIVFLLMGLNLLREAFF